MKVLTGKQISDAVAEALAIYFEAANARGEVAPRERQDATGSSLADAAPSTLARSPLAARAFPASPSNPGPVTPMGDEAAS